MAADSSDSNREAGSTEAREGASRRVEVANSKAAAVVNNKAAVGEADSNRAAVVEVDSKAAAAVLPRPEVAINRVRAGPIQKPPSAVKSRPKEVIIFNPYNHREDRVPLSAHFCSLMIL